MLKDLEMTVNPTYLDEQCTIVFSCLFKSKQKKMGEAVIYTGAAEFIEAQQKGEPITSELLMKRKKQDTIAWLKQLTIVEEYKEQTVVEISEFVKKLGIHTFIHREEAPPPPPAVPSEKESVLKPVSFLARKQQAQPIVYG